MNPEQIVLGTGDEVGDGVSEMGYKCVYMCCVLMGRESYGTVPSICMT